MQTLPSTEPGSVQATGLQNVFFVLGMPPGQGVGGGPPSPGLVSDHRCQAADWLWVGG